MIILKKLLYRIDEVSELLSFSKTQVHKLIEDGELLAHCHNGVRKKPLRILANSIEIYIEKYEIEPKSWCE